MPGMGGQPRYGGGIRGLHLREEWQTVKEGDLAPGSLASRSECKEGARVNPRF